MLAFSCPSCRQPVLIHESWSGQEAGCPHCGKRFLLPPILPRAASENFPIASPAPATDWRQVTGETVPQPPIFPIDWENVYRGLVLVQAACFVFMGTTIAWYVAFMASLEPPNLIWKPIAAVRVLAFAGLGVGLLTYFIGLSRCTRVPQDSSLRLSIRRSWIFTQVAIGFLLLATSDMVMGANPILPPQLVLGLLLGAMLTGISAHVFFIRFLEGIPGNFRKTPGRAAGLYQFFLAQIVLVHVLGLIYLGKANQQGFPFGIDRPVPQLRWLAAACTAMYLAAEIWFCCLVAGARNHVRLARRT